MDRNLLHLQPPERCILHLSSLAFHFPHYLYLYRHLQSSCSIPLRIRQRQAQPCQQYEQESSSSELNHPSEADAAHQQLSPPFELAPPFHEENVNFLRRSRSIFNHRCMIITLHRIFPSPATVGAERFTRLRKEGGASGVRVSNRQKGRLEEVGICKSMQSDSEPARKSLQWLCYRRACSAFDRSSASISRPRMLTYTSPLEGLFSNEFLPFDT